MKEKDKRGGRIPAPPRHPPSSLSQEFPEIRIKTKLKDLWKQDCFAMDEGLLIGFLTSAFPNSFSVI